MINLYLIRHGKAKSGWNSFDPGLDDNGEQQSKKIALVINTGGGNSESRINDALALRRGTLANKIPYCTNMSTAYSFLEAINSLKTKKLKVKSLQEN